MDILEQGDNRGFIDLESGWGVREADRSKDPNPANAPKKKFLKRAFGGVLRFEGSADSKPSVASSTLRYGEVASDRFADRFLSENRPLNIPYSEKPKKTNSRKPPKPPRPPKPPLLNDIDRKLARDAAEAAIRKRARIEQMKAQKKKGAADASTSSSSSSSTIVALFITVLFFIIMIYQGMSSQNAVVSFNHTHSDVFDSQSASMPVQPLRTFDDSEKGIFFPPHPSNSTPNGA